MASPVPVAFPLSDTGGDGLFLVAGGRTAAAAVRAPISPPMQTTRERWHGRTLATTRHRQLLPAHINGEFAASAR